MPFRFPLASVLRFRESVEKREEVVLQKAQLEVARAQRKIEEVTLQLAKACAERERTLQQAIPASRLLMIQAKIDAAADARQSLSSTLETLRRERDAQMKRYMSAHSGRQMLTDLLAQQRNEYDREQVRMQQKMLDDIFSARRQRN
ncbi:MAG: flagellar export protein FliJ [Terracidiphilus sp.]